MGEREREFANTKYRDIQEKCFWEIRERKIDRAYLGIRKKLLR